MQIRLAIGDDAPAIASMSRDYIEHGLPWGWRETKVRLAIDDRQTNVVVAQRGCEIAGFGIMAYHDDDAHLKLFAVRRAFQGRGLGRALLTWLEKVACASGVQVIRVEARRDNRQAIEFYMALGYEAAYVRERMYSETADGIGLEKRLF